MLRGLALTLVAASLAVAAACSGGDDAGDVDSSVDAVATTDAAPADASPDAYVYDGGMPIKHVIVIVKENHTFDNYFGTWDAGGETPQLTAKLHDGKTITRPKCPSAGITRDLSHSHASAVQAFHDGGMNGLDLNANTVAPPDGGKNDYLAWCYFDESNQLDVYAALAKSYTLADHFFTTTLAPSFPGHLASAIGQSPAYDNPGCPSTDPTCQDAKSAWGCVDEKGITVDTFDPDTCTTTGAKFPCWDLPTWMDEMPSDLDWRVYGGFHYTDDAGAPVILSPFNAVKKHATAAERIAHFRDEKELAADIAGLKTLPAVMFWSDADYKSEHPPSSPCAGEMQDAMLLQEIMARPEWNETAVLITFDDWGGFYDHVAPKVERCKNGEFYNPGFRVPLLVVSPFARPGYVFTGVSEQASIPRFIAEVFGLPFASAKDPHARDGKAGSLLGAFDFTQPPRPGVPPPLTCP